jgi:hypothetical protein
LRLPRRRRTRHLNYRDHRLYGHGFPFRDFNFSQHPGGGRGYFSIDFIGGNFKKGLIPFDFIAGLF